MSFNLQDDMNDIFLNSGFEEDITYTPSDGVAKTIKAVIFRGSGRHTSQSGRVGGDRVTKDRSYDIQIIISSDADEGQDDVTLKKDIVVMKERDYDTGTHTFSVNGIISSDSGSWHLGLKS